MPIVAVSAATLEPNWRTARAIATNQLTVQSRRRAVWRRPAWHQRMASNIALLTGVGVTLVLGSAQLGGVIAAAMLASIAACRRAGAAGTGRAGADPAVSSKILTVVTDSMGFAAGLVPAAGPSLSRSKS
jgi:magnesium transporter